MCVLVCVQSVAHVPAPPSKLQTETTALHGFVDRLCALLLGREKRNTNMDKSDQQQQQSPDSNNMALNYRHQQVQTESAQSNQCCSWLVAVSRTVDSEECDKKEDTRSWQESEANIQPPRPSHRLAMCVSLKVLLSSTSSSEEEGMSPPLWELSQLRLLFWSKQSRPILMMSSSEK